MLNIECLIFDMDGLMFDSERIATISLREAGKKFGYEIKDEVRNQLLGRNKNDGIQVMKNTYGEDFPIEEVFKYSMVVRDQYIKDNGLPIKAGLIELLDYAKAKKIKMIVASSSSRDVIKANLSLTNTTSYFDDIIGGDEVVNSKPNPEIFLKACEKCGATADKSLVLEDSESGILAAKNAGIEVICIPDIITHPKEINDMAYKVLNNLEEVIEEIK